MMKMGCVTQPKNVVAVGEFIKQTVLPDTELVVFVSRKYNKQHAWKWNEEIVYYYNRQDKSQFNLKCVSFFYGISTVGCNYSFVFSIVRDSGNGETNDKVAYFSNPSFPFKDSDPNYITYTIKVCYYIVG